MNKQPKPDTPSQKDQQENPAFAASTRVTIAGASPNELQDALSENGADADGGTDKDKARSGAPRRGR